MLNKFFDPSTPSVRKVYNGSMEWKKTKSKKKLFIVATNVVASRLPEQRPTGKPTSRANKKLFEAKAISIGKIKAF